MQGTTYTYIRCRGGVGFNGMLAILAITPNGTQYKYHQVVFSEVSARELIQKFTKNPPYLQSSSWQKLS